jgi:hypothetical protein
MEESSSVHNAKKPLLLLAVFPSLKQGNEIIQTVRMYTFRPQLFIPTSRHLAYHPSSFDWSVSSLLPRLAERPIKGGVCARQVAYRACTDLSDVPHNIPEFLFLT